MVNPSDSTDAAAADPWLKAALQRPAGPRADSVESPGPVSQSDVDPVPAPPAEGGEEPDTTEAPLSTPQAEAEGPDVAGLSAGLSPSTVRRLAVQALYVLGTEPDIPHDALLEALDEPFDADDEPEAGDQLPEAAKEAAVRLALAAWAGHRAADADIVARVPAWPTSRQPPVDRAILRLAHHELTTGRAPFAVVIDEAVELAHAFGEERTAGFVNAVLDAIARGQPARDTGGTESGEVRRATGDRPAAGAAEARRGQRERFNQRKAAMAAKIGPKRPRDADREWASDAAAERASGPVDEPSTPAAPAASGSGDAGEGFENPVAPSPTGTEPPAAPAQNEAAASTPPADPWAAAAARRAPSTPD